MIFRWLYDHPFEEDQKSLSAFLNASERNSMDTFPSKIPNWATLDPVKQFVTVGKFADTGWIANENDDFEEMIMFHFLHGESETSFANGGQLDLYENTKSKERKNGLVFDESVPHMAVFFASAPVNVYKEYKNFPAQNFPAMKRVIDASKRNVSSFDPEMKTGFCGPIPIFGLLHIQRIEEKQRRHPFVWKHGMLQTQR